MKLLRGRNGRSQKILHVRRTCWNREKEKRVEIDEMPSSHRGAEKTYLEMEREKEIRRMYDLVIRSRKVTLREELARAPLDPYPMKHFRPLQRRASLPFTRSDAILREATT